MNSVIFKYCWKVGIRDFKLVKDTHTFKANEVVRCLNPKSMLFGTKDGRLETLFFDEITLCCNITWDWGFLWGKS